MAKENFGKSVSLDKIERAVLINLIDAGYRSRFIDSALTADAMKSIRAKVDFSPKETEALKAQVEAKKAGPATAQAVQPGSPGFRKLPKQG